MKYITLSKGYSTEIDDEDFDVVSQSNWHVHIDRRKDGSIRGVYAIRNISTPSGRTSQKLHRLLMGVTDPKVEVDHIDHNGLNNRRNNLRVATHSQNAQNRVISPLCNTSGHKGVVWHKRHAKWQAQIKIYGKIKHLGYFERIEDAVVAYNKAAAETFGEFANPNRLPMESSK